MISKNSPALNLKSETTNGIFDDIFSGKKNVKNQFCPTMKTLKNDFGSHPMFLKWFLHFFIVDKTATRLSKVVFNINN